MAPVLDREKLHLNSTDAVMGDVLLIEGRGPSRGVACLICGDVELQGLVKNNKGTLHADKS